MNLRPFQISGLCEAVIAMPHADFELSVNSCTVGVGTIPKDITVKPALCRVPATIFSIHLPEGLPSLPSTTVPLGIILIRALM